MIGATIRAARLDRGWSQERLAYQLNHASGTPTVTRAEVSRWERGTRTPGDYWLAWLARVLGFPLDYLMEARGKKLAARTRARSAGRLAKVLG